VKDKAEIVKVIMYGRTIYQVNLINTRTGMYYNSSSLWFDTMDEAKEYILKNDLI
jgi:hypothetical protein